MVASSAPGRLATDSAISSTSGPSRLVGLLARRELLCHLADYVSQTVELLLPREVAVGATGDGGIRLAD